MKVEHLTGKTIKGISVVTRNSDEIESVSAKIGPLWQNFYSTIQPALKAGAKIYGVYHQYESDHSGKFTVTAGADLIEGSVSENLQQISIIDGDYLVFSGAGAMPQAVIDLWQQIWTYFSSTDCPHKRAYKTDFELYKNQTEVDIYIGIK